MDSCTFNKTGKKYHHQYWKRCIDCFPNPDEGACLNCISVCHNGHNIESKLRQGNFYCDCGSKGPVTCKLVKKRPITTTDPWNPSPKCKICKTAIISSTEGIPPVYTCMNGHTYIDESHPVPHFPSYPRPPSGWDSSPQYPATLKGSHPPSMNGNIPMGFSATRMRAFSSMKNHGTPPSLYSSSKTKK